MSDGVREYSAEIDWPESPRRPDRRVSVFAAVDELGLNGAKDKTIGGRVPFALVEAAKAQTGIQSDSELLLYALSKVALEDDFGPILLSMKGSVPKDVALDI